MDIVVWFIEQEEGSEATMASAVTAVGVVALSALTLSTAPVYTVQLKNTPQEFLEQLPEGVVVCLFIDDLLSELEPEIKTLQ